MNSFHANAVYLSPRAKVGIKILLGIPAGLIIGRGGADTSNISSLARAVTTRLDETAFSKTIREYTWEFSHIHKTLMLNVFLFVHLLLISLGANVPWEKTEEQRFAKKVVLMVVTLR